MLRGTPMSWASRLLDVGPAQVCQAPVPGGAHLWRRGREGMGLFTWTWALPSGCSGGSPPRMLVLPGNAPQGVLGLLPLPSIIPFLSRTKEPHLFVWPSSFLFEMLPFHSQWDTSQQGLPTPFSCLFCFISSEVCFNLVASTWET